MEKNSDMEQTRFYYSFEPVAIDVSDEKEAKKIRPSLRRL